MTKNRFLKKLGIIRHVLKKDLLFFFLPWLTIFYCELVFCRKYGDGLSEIWGVLWDVIKYPPGLFMLSWQRALGLTFFVLGLTIMTVSQVTLWENYSGFVVIKKDHQLITHGMYRYTRNPIYLGSIIVFTGLPIYAKSVYGFLAGVTIIPILLYRIRMEEELLAEYFGDEYETYRNRTRKLIPFLY